jgi:uroporphyrinogen-III synthase
MRRSLLRGEIDAVTFTSPSTVEAYVRSFPPAQHKNLFRNTRAVSLGPVTSEALRRVRATPAATARETTPLALVDAVRRSFQEKRK